MSKLTYIRCGDYDIPNLKLSEQPETSIGKYGRMRKSYLKEHRPILYNQLLMSEKLYPHLLEIDWTAQERVDTMLPHMMEAAGVTEELKACDPMRWVGLMNTLTAQIEEIAKKNAEKSGGSFTKTNSMEEAFKDADIVYPKSWAPFAAMEKRTNLYGEGDFDGIDKLEKELLAQNAEHKDWACTEELMKTTKDGKALYLHCLPADITGVSCETGEVDASVFDRYRIPLYKEASFKPYVIAAMIMLSKFENPQDILKKLEVKAAPRIME